MALRHTTNPLQLLALRQLFHEAHHTQAGRLLQQPRQRTPLPTSPRRASTLIWCPAQRMLLFTARSLERRVVRFA